MPLSVGTTIGPYEILGSVGAGGMGEVYRARDPRLAREVAIKLLPDGVGENTERLRRFELEARAASALNHPNILVIHDGGIQEGVFYIVSELLEGETLRQKLKLGALPARMVIDYGIQIAHGLAAAHTRGIVHRDLKPENLFVTREGRIKILDFGLAKFETPTVSSDETETHLSQPGVVLGTPAYMSPEQVRGLPVDHRSDIFTYGSLLYEMLTGRPTFTGASSVEVMNAILKEDPQPLSDSNSPLLAQIVMRCLEKQAAERFESIRDVAHILESVSGITDRHSIPIPSASPKQRRAAFMPSVAVLTLVAAAIAAGWWWFKVSEQPAGVMTLTKLTRDSGLTTDPAMSPDGKLIAYASDRASEGNLDVYVQQIGGGQPIRITEDQADDSEPSFFPDGTRIVFRSQRDGGGIFVVPALGGAARRLTREGHNPRVSPDGKWIAYWDGVVSGDNLLSRMFVIALDGGKPRQLQPEFRGASYPTWAPDSQHVLFRGTKSDGESTWWVTAIDSGETSDTGLDRIRQTAGPTFWSAAFSLGGRFLIFSGGDRERSSIWRVPISQKTWQIEGQPQRLTVGTAVDDQPATSVDARMAFFSGTGSINFFSLPIDANRGRRIGDPQQLTDDDALKLSVDVSLDGKKITYLSNRSGYFTSWMKDLISRKEAPITTASISGGSILNNDGSKIAFVTKNGVVSTIWSTQIDGGTPEKIWEESQSPQIWDWSPDSRTILVGLKQVMHGLDVSSGRTVELARHPQYRLYNFYFSPDGRWIVFEARNKPDRNRLYVIPFHSTTPVPESEWITITDGTQWDDKPRWSPDGNMLYFVSYRDGFLCIWAIRLDPATKKSVGAPFAVYHSHGARRSLSNSVLSQIYIPVASDKLVLPLGERRGNIWLADLPTN